MEILPGIHRIESDLGYASCASTSSPGRTTRSSSIPAWPGLREVIIPYLEGVGLSLEDIDEVIISHADVDHCGGNRALKEMHPALWFTCGEPDRAYVENNEVMTAEIYRWSGPTASARTRTL